MENNLKRTLNLKDAISIVAGSMIGSGIFIVSSEISRQTNSIWLLMLCWVIAGVSTLCGALCYGELSSTISDTSSGFFGSGTDSPVPYTLLYICVSVSDSSISLS